MLVDRAKHVLLAVTASHVEGPRLTPGRTDLDRREPAGEVLEVEHLHANWLSPQIAVPTPDEEPEGRPGAVFRTGHHSDGICGRRPWRICANRGGEIGRLNRLGRGGRGYEKPQHERACTSMTTPRAPVVRHVPLPEHMGR